MRNDVNFALACVLVSYTSIQGTIDLVADFMRTYVNWLSLCLDKFTTIQGIIQLLVDFMRNDVNFAIACFSVSLPQFKVSYS